MADTISYSCVAYGTTVLAEGYFLSSVPPFAHIARKLLSRISLTDSKKTFQVKEFVIFHKSGLQFTYFLLK